MQRMRISSWPIKRKKGRIEKPRQGGKIKSNQGRGCFDSFLFFSVKEREFYDKRVRGFFEEVCLFGPLRWRILLGRILWHSHSIARQ